MGQVRARSYLTPSAHPCEILARCELAAPLAELRALTARRRILTANSLLRALITETGGSLAPEMCS